MFIVREDNKIMENFPISDKVEVHNVHRQPNDSSSVLCRAVIVLKNIDIAVEYTQFKGKEGLPPFGRISGRSWRKNDGRKAFTQHIQVIDPSTGSVTPASFGLTNQLEKLIANAIDQYEFVDDISDASQPLEAAHQATQTEEKEKKDEATQH